MKLVKQYLQEIPDDNIRTKALKNLQVERANDRANGLAHAIFTAFLWHRTPEKFAYWSAIHHNIRHPHDLKQVPKIK